ncbi:MAG: Asp23/Gls24 family envelope stress response protein [Oscillospiraceae bacterium]|jgi:uncharacterized alkaline shock family protein YloU|nr:Asp23/Gls24 family envelope stress response protein [Oscillospiraceae bacterium]
MNDNLPAHVESSLAEIGTITYANEVIAIIAGMAASEIDGVAAMGTTSSIVDILGRNRKPITKGVKVEVGSEEASVDLVFSVEYGKPIQRVCRDVQESVRKAIETMTGLHVVKVDVHVLGVSFERETQQIAEGLQAANLSIDSGKRGQPVRAKKETDVKPQDAPQPPREVCALDVDVPSEPNNAPKSNDPVAGDKSVEPETANRLPSPVEEDSITDAVFAAAVAIDDELLEDIEPAATAVIVSADVSAEDTLDDEPASPETAKNLITELYPEEPFKSYDPEGGGQGS